MSVVHLVRHGQASWGSDDYDLLSDLGMAQSTWLGTSWEAVEWMPTCAWAGSMRRHEQTAIAALDAAGPSEGYEVDPGWDEFDHEAIAAAHQGATAVGDPKAFQHVLNEALLRWRRGEGGHAESYAAFVDRVMTAFDTVATTLGRGESAVVFTSGGPISMVASHLLAGDDQVWQRLNNVVVNTGVSTIVIGASGRNLLTFNNHSHLPTDAVTYR